MARSGFPLTSTALAAVGLLAATPVAQAQAPAAPARPPSPAAAPAADAHAQVEDRVFALVQAGKCGQARTAAEQGNEPELATQIGQMCGLKPGAAASPSGASGHRSGGGQGAGMGAGRRGGP